MQRHGDELEIACVVKPGARCKGHKCQTSPFVRRVRMFTWQKSHKSHGLDLADKQRANQCQTQEALWRNHISSRT